jgi:hypothetical protein
VRLKGRWDKRGKVDKGEVKDRKGKKRKLREREVL